MHAKISYFKKRVNKKLIQYGFISTGSLNEKTASIYGDHFLLTSNRFVMADINRIFKYLESSKANIQSLNHCKTLFVSPVSMRKNILKLINTEINNAKAGKKASILIKMNSISDKDIIYKLYQAEKAGVNVQLVVRGILCLKKIKDKPGNQLQAIRVL